jgi:hypothetical protein
MREPCKLNNLIKIFPTDGPELDPREKALTALALRSLANHFILNRPNKKQINLTYPNNNTNNNNNNGGNGGDIVKAEDPKQRFVSTVRCRSTKIKQTVFRRSSQSSSAGRLPESFIYYFQFFYTGFNIAIN